MNIGIVCYPTFGGSGVVATELGIALSKKGHQVHFMTYKRPARLTPFMENVFYHEVSTYEYPLFEYKPYETALASKMVDVVLHENLDILHVHYAIPHAAVAYMAQQILKSRGKFIPIVTTLHGTDITLVGNDPAFSPVVEFSINFSNGVTAVSNHLREATFDSFNITNEIEVIYNFIDFERFNKIDKNHFKMAISPNGEKIIAHTSNFRKVKRVQDVIMAFAKIHKEIPSKLLLIGDGPERNNLEQLCRTIGLCDHIRFLGKQNAVEELLAVADLFIIPSENESFGLAALEAMACGVPVISSNAGGLPELNLDGKTGYTLDVGDVDGMAEKGIYILKDEATHTQFSEAAYAHAKTFDIKNILPKYEAYYEKVIEKMLASA
ncbi:N-acetyl-alpha-D-glucosaminyl L-malate synthase BshA [Portibacter lacus]|uniref:N-acetyl-alpha-D-glucosaminyl L-malate synthase BshA n=1 Tax=Portibacter lacus TaxID=1099794 RepID=A0AA37SSV4_9BACT|nr:N-acetyl-alpha-D-glucosaminyl L-malate synthase BshA [Portibacter lacus]GLR19718.1 N-acetyl-alpha-D-glucosaminyl L-malate synthase BshA [Portibacter lacus]